MLHRNVLFIALLPFFLLWGCTTAIPPKASTPEGKATVSFRFSLPEKRQVQSTDFDTITTCSIMILGENNTGGVSDSFAITPGVKSYSRSLSVRAGRNLIADVRFLDAIGKDVIWLKGVFSASNGQSVSVPVNWTTTITGWILDAYKDSYPVIKYGFNAQEIQTFVNRVVQATGSNPVTWADHPALVYIYPIKQAIDSFIAEGTPSSAITADLIGSRVATYSSDVDVDKGRRYAVLPREGISIFVQLVDPTGSQSFQIPSSGGYVAEYQDTDGDGQKDAYGFQGPAGTAGDLTIHVNDPVSADRQITALQPKLTGLPLGSWVISCLSGNGYSPKPWWEIGNAMVACNLMNTKEATASLPFHSLATLVKLDATAKKATTTCDKNGSWYAFEPTTVGPHEYDIAYSGVATGYPLSVFNDYDTPIPVSHLADSPLGVASGSLHVASNTRCVIYVPKSGATLTVSKTN